MTDVAGYGFTYNPGTGGSAPQEQGQPTELFAWQICLAHVEQGMLEDADNYPNYAINRDRICQTLGLGMTSGQNALPMDGQMFVVAISIQVNDAIQVIDASHPNYNGVALVVAEQLLRGEDHGMVALLPNGNLVPFTPPTDPQNL